MKFDAYVLAIQFSTCIQSGVLSYIQSNISQLFLFRLPETEFNLAWPSQSLSYKAPKLYTYEKIIYLSYFLNQVETTRDLTWMDGLET